MMWTCLLKVLVVTVALTSGQRMKDSSEQIHFHDSEQTDFASQQQPYFDKNIYDKNLQQSNLDVNRIRPYVQAQPVKPEQIKPFTLGFPKTAQTNYERQKIGNAASTVGKSSLTKASVGVTDFGLRMMKAISKVYKQNIVVSPYSIAISLGLLSQGATGDTQNQIAFALQMLPEEISTSFKTSLDYLKKSATNNILEIATSLFADKTFSLNPAFKSVAINKFDSDVTPVDFKNTASAADLINGWVAEKTHNHIKNLLSPDSLRDVAIAMANAVFFKGAWQSKFHPSNTRKRDFTLKNGATRKVPFMSLTGGFKIGYDKKIFSQILNIPFENHEYSMIIILPDLKTNLDTVIMNLSDDQLFSYHNITIREATVIIPKFAIRSETNLRTVLPMMEISGIFSPISELSGIGTDESGISPSVTTALHTAVLSIDELGGTALAATAFAAVPLSAVESYRFEANRPFLAVLWHNELKMPLFIASIEDPTS